MNYKVFQVKQQNDHSLLYMHEENRLELLILLRRTACAGIVSDPRSAQTPPCASRRKTTTISWSPHSPGVRHIGTPVWVFSSSGRRSWYTGSVGEFWVDKSLRMEIGQWRPRFPTRSHLGASRQSLTARFPEGRSRFDARHEPLASLASSRLPARRTRQTLHRPSSSCHRNPSGLSPASQPICFPAVLAKRPSSRGTRALRRRPPMG